MKSFFAFFLALILSLAAVLNVNAQAAESIWLTAETTTYKSQETVIVVVNAVSATPIQGFTFQIRYDPDCLRPLNATSTIRGMNALPLPQLSGLVDGSYASTTPQVVNGVLAEVRFTALKGCQTNLTLESAALAVRNQSGFAAPLAGVTLGEKSISITIDKAKGEAQPYQPLEGSILPLEPPAAKPGLPTWAILVIIISSLAIGVGFVAFKLLGPKPGPAAKSSTSTRVPSLQIQRGPQAGKRFALTKLPYIIGRDPGSDLCLNDPTITSQHAKIFSNAEAYFLMDLGGGTYLNGQAVKRGSAPLKPGDVVRLGKSALLVFRA